MANKIATAKLKLMLMPHNYVVISIYLSMLSAQQSNINPCTMQLICSQYTSQYKEKWKKAV